MSEAQAGPGNGQERDPTLIVSGICGILLLVHLAVRYKFGTIKDGLDPVALGLALVGLSPWIATIFKTLKFAGVEVNFQEVQARVIKQGLEIEQLKFLIANFLPQWELKHLTRLAEPGDFIVDLDRSPPTFETELRHLRSMGFLENSTEIGMTEFIRGKPRQKNVKDYFRITESGRRYLKYREPVEGAPPPSVPDKPGAA